MSGALTLIDQAATLGVGIGTSFSALTLDGGTLDLAGYNLTVATANMFGESPYYSTISGPGTLAITGPADISNTTPPPGWTTVFYVLGGATLLDLGSIVQVTGPLELDGTLAIGVGASYTITGAPACYISPAGPALLSNAGLLDVFNGGFLNEIDTYIASTGTIRSEAGDYIVLTGGGSFSGMLSGPGEINLDGAFTLGPNLTSSVATLVNYQTATVIGKQVTITSNVQGNGYVGTIVLDPGASLDTQNSVSSQDILFSTGSELQIGTLSEFASVLSGFSGTDIIDLSNVQSNLYTYANNILSLYDVQNGTTIAAGSLSLVGFSGAISLESDKLGGTDIALTAASPVIGTLTLDDQSATLGIGLGTSFTTITIDGGTLDLAGYDATITAGIFVDGGTLAGPGTLAIAGTLLVNTVSNGFDVLDGATLVDLGAFDQTNGQLYLDGNMIIGAGAGYTLSFDTGGGLSPYSSINEDGAATVTNAGLIYSTGYNGIYSANPNFISAVVNSTGTIYSAAGSDFQLRNGGSLSGTLTGPGEIDFDGGSFTLTSNLLVNAATLGIEAGLASIGYMSGPPATTLNIGGTLDVDSVFESRQTIFVAAGELQLQDGGSLVGTLAGTGTIALDGGNFTLGPNLLVSAGTLINDSTDIVSENSTVTIVNTLVADRNETGYWVLDAGATLATEGSVEEQAFIFATTSGELAIGTLAEFGAPVQGFGTGDTIDIQHIQANSYTYSNGQDELFLREVQNGATTTVGQFHVIDLVNALTLSSDGDGGTDITQGAPPITSSSWLGGSSTWRTAADWSAGIPDSKTIAAVIEASGSYTVTLASGTSEIVDGVTQNDQASTLDLLGALNLSGTHVIVEYVGGEYTAETLSGSIYELEEGSLTLAAGGALNGYGIDIGNAAGSASGTATLLLAGASAAVTGIFIDNTGTVLASGNATLSGTLENAGTILVGAGDDLALTGSEDGLSNDGHLSQGVWAAEGGTISLAGSAITGISADIILSGSASQILAGTAAVSLESSLTDIATAGELEILDRSFVTANTLSDTGSIQLAGTLSDAGLNIYGGALEGSGKLTGHVSIGNSGAILDTGTLLMTGGVTGRGLFSIASGSDLILEGAVAPGLTVAFGGGAGATLVIGDQATERPVLSGLTVSDVIDIARTPVTAATLSGNLLQIMLASGSIVTETLAGTFSGESFSISSDGAKGSDLTVYTLSSADLALAPMRFVSAGANVSSATELFAATHASNLGLDYSGTANPGLSFSQDALPSAFSALSVASGSNPMALSFASVGSHGALGG